MKRDSLEIHMDDTIYTTPEGLSPVGCKSGELERDGTCSILEHINPRGDCPRGQQVLLDRDVAALYGVETRIINQAVKNNPGKFPAGYVVELTQEEVTDLRSKFLTAY